MIMKEAKYIEIEPELVQRVQNGDSAAFTELYQKAAHHLSHRLLHGSGRGSRLGRAPERLPAGLAEPVRPGEPAALPALAAEDRRPGGYPGAEKGSAPVLLGAGQRGGRGAPVRGDPGGLPAGAADRQAGGCPPGTGDPGSDAPDAEAPRITRAMPAFGSRTASWKSAIWPLVIATAMAKNGRALLSSAPRTARQRATPTRTACPLSLLRSTKRPFWSICGRIRRRAARKPDCPTSWCSETVAWQGWFSLQTVNRFPALAGSGWVLRT